MEIERSHSYLTNICLKLKASEEGGAGLAPMIVLEMVELILTALDQLLLRIRHSCFHDELPQLIDLTHAITSKLPIKARKLTLIESSAD